MRSLPILFLAAACATPAAQGPKGGPRGLRASDHLDVAAREDELAREATRWPTATSHMTPGGTSVTPTIPWTRRWDPAGEHERLAATHRGKAAALYSAYVDACGDRSLAEVSVSPLVRWGTGGWNTATGAIIYLDPKVGGPDHLLSELKCHRAWMMLGPAGQDSCPLDLPGLLVDARGGTEGITVSLGVKDASLIPELQRRVAGQLEVAQHGRHEPPPAPSAH